MSAVNAQQRVMDSDYFISGKSFSSVEIAEMLGKTMNNTAVILHSMAADGILTKMPNTGYKKSSNARYWLGLPWRAGIYLDDETETGAVGPLEWRLN